MAYLLVTGLDSWHLHRPVLLNSTCWWHTKPLSTELDSLGSFGADCQALEQEEEWLPSSPP